jgi:hypothetical protein
MTDTTRLTDEGKIAKLSKYLYGLCPYWDDALALPVDIARAIQADLPGLMDVLVETTELEGNPYNTFYLPPKPKPHVHEPYVVTCEVVKNRLHVTYACCAATCELRWAETVPITQPEDG